MGLQPLEFSDCLVDSPFLRSKLQEHEQELEGMNKAIKVLIQHGREVFDAARQLSQAQKIFAKDLKELQFKCIDKQTDDETTIVLREDPSHKVFKLKSQDAAVMHQTEAFAVRTLSEFGKYLLDIEQLRETMVNATEMHFIQRLEAFTRNDLDAVKDHKKNFDKQTTIFCQSQERYLGIKSKASESQLKEADVQMEADKLEFYQASMKYVLKLQEMHEKKKFEFVENLLGYMSGWMTFYHEGYEKLGDFRLNDKRLRLLLQKARENFECTKGEAEQLMDKMLKAPGTELMDQSAMLQGFTRQGYLYLMEKKALSTSWTKYFCQYKKETKELFFVVYNQSGGKMGEADKYILQSCTRRKTESIDRRFCFDVIVKDRTNPITFQALSGDDRRYWLDALDGREPVYLVTELKSKSFSVSLNEDGFNFVKKVIAAVEARGLETEGLYRLPGVQSAVATLLEKALRRDHKKSEPNFEDPIAVDTKTLTSALKHYFRSLSEPLMTFDLYDSFVAAAKQETDEQRLESVMLHIKKLPSANFDMLALLVGHLARIAEKSAVNGMSSANLAICFSPSLIRPRAETMASVLDLRFCSIFVEIIIKNYEKIFRLRADAFNCGEARWNASHRPSFSVASLRESDSSVVQRRKSSPAIKTPETAGPDHLMESLGPVKAGKVSALAKHFNQTSKANFTGSGSIKLRNLSDSIVPGATSSRSEKKINNKKDSNEEFKKPELEEGTPGHEYELVDRVAGRLAKSKYACTGGSVSELSFEANQIIRDVRPSFEEGWLVGELNGKVGLVPENYVEYID